MTTLNLNPWKDCGKVQQQFILSKDFEVALFGSRGEGKTEAGWRRIIMHAALQPEECRPIPWLIARDTWRNLERTTLRSLLFPHPGSICEQIRPLIKISNKGEHISLPGLFEADLFGIDSLGDISRLQSLQLGGLWVEEPAPAASEDIGGGVEERVVTVGITSLRHPCDWRTCQITSNYPDEDHWSWQRYAVKKLGRLFRVPRGENQHLPEDYRSKMEKALAGDKGLLQRLVLGMPGFVSQGEEVTPEYNELIHRSERELEPYPNVVGYRLWDGWSNPACIIAQMTPRGQFQIFEVIVGQKMGVKQLIAEFVKPAMKARYSKVPDWIDIGDPSMTDADQSTYEQSAASVIEQMLDTSFQVGPKLWSPRKEAIKIALLQNTEGQMLSQEGGFPFIQLSNSPLTQPLHQALRGGWHYRMDASGRRVGKIPVKDRHSHPADALTYGVCEVLTLSGQGMIDPYAHDFDEPFMHQLDDRVGRSAATGY